MQKLQTVNAETLLYEPLEKPSFVVDSLIPTGLSLFCGSQKIGKSWLMLKLCLCVSQGIPLWDMPTMEGDVLYLCLEDTFCRIQDRLFRLTDEASGRLHFAVASCKLSDGLIVQLEDYLKDYPDSRYSFKRQCLCKRLWGHLPHQRLCRQALSGGHCRTPHPKAE